MAGTEENTRDRLLDHAERLFAEKGFAAVSVREITSAADCNLAAVNYHFGGKQNLYLSVFRERWAMRARRINSSFKGALEGSQQPAFEEVIWAMAKAFLEGPITDAERRIHVQLMQREVSDPGEALTMIVEEVMEPYIQEFTDLIRPHIKEGIKESRLRLTALSIVGVALYFFMARPIVSIIMQKDYDERFRAELISHITAFSLHGIQALNMER